MISPFALLEPKPLINLSFYHDKVILVGFRAVLPDACYQRSQEAIPEMFLHNGPHSAACLSQRPAGHARHTAGQRFAAARVNRSRLREGLAAGEELGPNEKSGARLQAIPEGRRGAGPDGHRYALLRHDRGRDQPHAGHMREDSKG
jgi:hypothetical protein